ncbi:hypothetical protein Vretifemale_8039 [Volvox reticuliferus]|uniref:Uncharacterized protein n=1 Tax=Volvox reticuliferus TaxID=1737510 RepID=A0A8J4CA45_9CHLO|nr:hypothetical protein Vretifemale_8039 [Volvox reticuliferus]
MNRWKVAGARPRKYGLLVIAAQLLMGFLAPAATYTITVYSNVAVTGKPGVVDSVNKLLTDFPRAAISVSSLKQSNSQPSSTELASTNAFIIYAAGSRSYFDTEGLATNPAKLSALASWITAGGSLILADGADTTNSVASNSFISLINALLGPGQEAGCKAAAFDLTTRIFRRFDPPSVFGFLPVKNFRYQQGDTFSALACRSGLPIYSSNATQKMFSRAAALTWGLGKGAITWTGANILTNPNGPIALVVAAAVIVEPLALPPPPPPPPSPQRPPPRRSPPPSPPPPPPPVRSPPPPPPVRSPPPPPPVRSPPPPPPVRFPPPPPPVRSPPPPPPVRFPPLPPPVRSPPPPPPVRSPPPPPPVRSPPPSPPVRSPPPLPVRAPPPPSIFSRPAPPPPPPPRGRLPSSPPVGSPPSNKPSTGRRRPPPPPYEAPPPYMDYGPPPLI